MNEVEKSNIKKIKRKYFDKKLSQAQEIDCGCGCGQKMLEYDNYARKRKFIKGHRIKKYNDPKQFKREWNKRNKKKRYEYKKKWLKKKRHEFLIEKGGKCIKCEYLYDGTNAIVFDFHHREPHKKEIFIRFNQYSMKKIREELEKCDILCANCHRLEHNDL